MESTNWFGTLNYGAIVAAGERAHVSRFTARFSGNAVVHSSCSRPGGFCNHSFSYGHIHHGGMVGLDSANLYTSGRC